MSFAADFIRAFVQTHAPTVPVAFGVETGAGAGGTRIRCTKPTCAEAGARVSVTGVSQVPLLQTDVDAMASAQCAPLRCDFCGTFLTAIVDGPDPRD